jgi:hypothetical protein
MGPFHNKIHRFVHLAVRGPEIAELYSQRTMLSFGSIVVVTLSVSDPTASITPDVGH